MNLVAECTTIVAPHSIGSAQVRRGEGVVHNQRDAVRVCQLRQPLDVQNRAFRVADGLAVERARFGRNRALPRLEIAWVDELDRHAHLLEGVRELGGRAAVEVRGADNLVAWLQQGVEGQELRRHAAGGRHRARAPLQARHALFEHGGGWVHDARVDVAVLFEFEQLRGVVGVVEHERSGLVNRHGARPRVWVGNVPRMQHARFEAKLSRFCAHRVCKCTLRRNLHGAADRNQHIQ
jgi:hypothetical protein